MIADYFFVRKQNLDVDALYRRGSTYEYRNGVNWIAMVALMLGVAPNVPGFLGALGVIRVAAFWSSIYNWAWFVGFLLSAIIYIAGMRSTSRPAAREPARAGV
jgi:NCS1 family nucleobase:cation symporter-1